MTGGGPGFTTDVIASVIYKQYQAGFYGLSTAGNVVLFSWSSSIVVPLSWFLNRQEVELMRTVQPNYWLESPSSIVAFAVVFLVPFVFILLTAAKTAARVGAARLLLADALAARRRTSKTCFGHERLHAGHRVHQQHDPHRRSASRSWSCSPPWSASCSSDAASTVDDWSTLLVLAGLIIPPAVVPTIWVLQKARPVQDHARPDPGRGRLRRCRSASCSSARSSRRSRASSTRRRSSTAAGRFSLFFRVDLPAAAAGDRSP